MIENDAQVNGRTTTDQEDLNADYERAITEPNATQHHQYPEKSSSSNNKRPGGLQY